MLGKTLTFVFTCTVFAYAVYTAVTLYSLYFPKPCGQGALCIAPQWTLTSIVTLKVGLNGEDGYSQATVFFKQFNLSEGINEIVNISTPSSLLKNRSVSADVELRFFDDILLSKRISLTSFKIPKKYYLSAAPETGSKPIVHWQRTLEIGFLGEPFEFTYGEVPQELHKYMKLYRKQDGSIIYQPLFYASELMQPVKDDIPFEPTLQSIPLHVHVRSFSLGSLRMYANLDQTFDSLSKLGFSKKDFSDVRSILLDTDPILLMVSLCVAILHLLLDVLTLKNDISFWKSTNDMVGLSRLIWKSLSSTVIFLYLVEEETSLLVTVPAFFVCLVETWKLIRVNYQLRSHKAAEEQTDEWDRESIDKLKWIIIPLCTAGLIYSIVYLPYRSAYSWVITVLANGTYAFGFLLMTPQLFINYRMKSVAHLPWRAMTYKAFTTFIDDFFAFIVKMPTSHRIACLRDDVIFFIYLYQRWLYPVDPNRKNEYGVSALDDGKGKPKKAAKMD